MKAQFILITEQAETLKDMEYATVTVTPDEVQTEYSFVNIETDNEQMFLFELFTKGQKYGVEQACKRLVKPIFE